MPLSLTSLVGRIAYFVKSMTHFYSLIGIMGVSHPFLETSNFVTYHDASFGAMGE